MVTWSVPDTTTFINDVKGLVECESPSRDLPALRASAEAVAGLIHARLGAPAELIDTSGGTHVRWGASAPRVLLLGHHDTVHPIGTLAEQPFSVHRGCLHGPGVFDMLTGIVMAIHASQAVSERAGLGMLWTADEEVGSASSRALIEQTANSAEAVLVFEPSARGAIKVERKGTGTFVLTFTGRAAHAGLEPERGANALVEMARQVERIVQLAEPRSGTTVTPTLCEAGVVENTVPDRATLTLDVRVQSMNEAERVTRALHSLEATLPGTTVTVAGSVGRPPLERSASRGLFARLEAIAQHLGHGSLESVSVGGGSDGNFTAAIGVPTLDGLGAIGDNLHRHDEYVELQPTLDRVPLISAFLHELLHG
jgi:glutamate carboxypeptidase